MSVEALRACPVCHVDWADGKYSRLIGIERRGVYDGVVEWMCPDCGARWDRFTGKRLMDEQRGDGPR